MPLTEIGQKRLRKLFIITWIITAPLPFLTLAAICGCFEGLISWYTVGETRKFLNKQRVILRRFFFVSLLMWFLFTIAITLYYLMWVKYPNGHV